MKSKSAISQKTIISTSMVAVLMLLVGSVIGYLAAFHKYHQPDTPTQNTPGYITADAARDQVNNFYTQYLHPRKDSVNESRKQFISTYGSRNLVFYSSYYKHGFDPIVCSTTMPSNITVTDVQPGAGATVKVVEKYDDGSTSNLIVELVLNNEGFSIDSITCPGDKGNLPPAL